jgi:hypothetical protein
MADATISAPSAAQTSSGTAQRAVSIVAWIGILSLALGFVIKYVLFYFVITTPHRLIRIGLAASGCFSTSAVERWPC